MLESCRPDLPPWELTPASASTGTVPARSAWVSAQVCILRAPAHEVHSRWGCTKTHLIPGSSSSWLLSREALRTSSKCPQLPQWTQGLLSPQHASCSFLPSSQFLLYIAMQSRNSLITLLSSHSPQQGYVCSRSTINANTYQALHKCIKGALSGTSSRNMC